MFNISIQTRCRTAQHVCFVKGSYIGAHAVAGIETLYFASVLEISQIFSHFA